MNRLMKQVAAYDLTPPLWGADMGCSRFRTAGNMINE